MNAVTLDQLGWDEGWAHAFDALTAVDKTSELVPGRVVLEHNHVYRVLTRQGEQLAESAGRMKHRAEGRHQLPVVGDWVALRFDTGGARVHIREVLPRRTSFSRKAAGRGTEQQVLAANVDLVFIVFGLDNPVNARSIDRYLVVAKRSGATPVIVLNKADLVADPAAALEEAKAAAGSVPVHAVSSHAGWRLDTLEQYLSRGRTVALLGPSGVGKSSLVNRLVERELLPTGEVREWDARGRHTSVHRQLVVRERGGLIIDTPGMRELQLWETDAVSDTFEDLQAIAASCRFRDCRHESEPGCAVKAAVDAGLCEALRVESYLKLQREQEAMERKREERGQIEEKRQSKSVHRAMRQMTDERARRGGT
ncbi:MAG: ribosome small subunit-dependent GTPase A [Vicinamibacterales bacterium]